jgi:hypothetical protein
MSSRRHLWAGYRQPIERFDLEANLAPTNGIGEQDIAVPSVGVLAGAAGREEELLVTIEQGVGYANQFDMLLAFRG